MFNIRLNLPKDNEMLLHVLDRFGANDINYTVLATDLSDDRGRCVMVGHLECISAMSTQVSLYLAEDGGKIILRPIYCIYDPKGSYMTFVGEGWVNGVGNTDYKYLIEILDPAKDHPSLQSNS